MRSTTHSTTDRSGAAVASPTICERPPATAEAARRLPQSSVVDETQVQETPIAHGRRTSRRRTARTARPDRGPRAAFRAETVRPATTGQRKSSVASQSSPSSATLFPTPGQAPARTCNRRGSGPRNRIPRGRRTPRRRRARRCRRATAPAHRCSRRGTAPDRRARCSARCLAELDRAVAADGRDGRLARTCIVPAVRRCMLRAGRRTRLGASKRSLPHTPTELRSPRLKAAPRSSPRPRRPARRPNRSPHLLSAGTPHPLRPVRPRAPPHLPSRNAAAQLFACTRQVPRTYVARATAFRGRRDKPAHDDHRDQRATQHQHQQPETGPCRGRDALATRRRAARSPRTGSRSP